jgi:drug/metabolite transporter (DMT)-like permease
MICAVLCAATILATDRCVKTSDPLQIAFMTIASCTVYSLIGGLVFEPFPMRLNGEIIAPLLYSALFGVMGGFMLMNVAMRYASPEYASLFMSTESAFGALFGVLLLSEVLTGRMAVGCALVLGALFFSQVQFKRKVPKEVLQNE